MNQRYSAKSERKHCIASRTVFQDMPMCFKWSCWWYWRSVDKWSIIPVPNRTELSWPTAKFTIKALCLVSTSTSLMSQCRDALNSLAIRSKPSPFEFTVIGIYIWSHHPLNSRLQGYIYEEGTAHADWLASLGFGFDSPLGTKWTSRWRL